MPGTVWPRSRWRDCAFRHDCWSIAPNRRLDAADLTGAEEVESIPTTAAASGCRGGSNSTAVWIAAPGVSSREAIAGIGVHAADPA